MLAATGARSQSSGEEFKPARLLEPNPLVQDQREFVQAALDGLPADRNHYALVVLRGDFVLKGPLLLDDYTSLDLRGARLTLSSDEAVSIFRNRAGVAGNQHIRLQGGILQGNRELLRKRGSSCIAMQNTSYLRVEGMQIDGCALDGILIDGRGKKASHVWLSDLVLTRNIRDGLLLTWAMREATVRDITARHNGRYGVYSDHSNSMYSNVLAERNGSHGIFIRNVFNNSYHRLVARHNGRHGIAVQGMVESTGLDWRASNNGFRPKLGRAADIFFSADSSLSYGITADSTVIGVYAGPSKYSAPGKARLALWVEPASGTGYTRVSLESVRLSGPARLPEAGAPTVDLLADN